MRRTLAGLLTAIAVVAGAPSGAAGPPTANEPLAVVGGANQSTIALAMTPDARYVMFRSVAANIVPGVAPAQDLLYRRDRTTGTTVLVSTTPSGGAPATSSGGLFTTQKLDPEVSISDDGRFVTFAARFSDLVADDENGTKTDVFVRDVTAGSTTRIDVNVSGDTSAAANLPHMSANGRWVSFGTDAGLAASDTNGGLDVYRWDRTNGAVALVSAGWPAGTAADGTSHHSFPADDGTVVYDSYASNLITTAGFGGADLMAFRRDPATSSASEPISKNAGGGFHYGPVTGMSPDGRYVLLSLYGKVVAADPTTLHDAYVRDTVAGTTTPALTGLAGAWPDAGEGTAVDISADGRYLLAVTRATNIVVGDTNTRRDVFALDRTTGVVRRVDRTETGAETTSDTEPLALSDDGRTALVQGTAALLAGTDAPKPSSAPSLAWGAVVPTGIARTYPVMTDTAFVQRQYQDLLGRAPTPTELSAALADLTAGAPKEALPIALRGDVFHVQIVDPVVRLYQAYFLRPPDAGGLDYWLTQRRTGWSLVRIADFFARSNEFKVRYGQLSNQELVARIYENILGRPGEPAGEAYWVDQLDRGLRSRGTVMLGFSESSEYKRGQAGATDVSVLFLFMLGRAPTAAERSGYVADLAAGGPLDDVVGDILESPEYVV